ncbi:MAG: hypothetical protein ABIT09_01060 [Croceibacterium sp.]
MRAAAALGLLALCGAAGAPPEGELRFVSCPIYRNTDSGPKSGCWLVDDPATGFRYDVSLAPSKPDWNQAVLVEGKLAASQIDACGGQTLDPVRVSIVPTPCTRFMIEAGAYSGHTFALPRRNVRPLYETRTRPGRPYAVRTFTIPFDLGSSFIVYQLGDYYTDAAINYALDVQPARVVVTGYAQTEPVTVSGQTIVEPVGLARERAEHVAQAFILQGIARDRISVVEAPASPTANEAFDGLQSASYRRVEVTIEPLAQSTPNRAG